MQPRLQFLLLLVVALSAAVSVRADEILQWVDAKGVTQFGDHNASPPHGARVVSVQSTNGMDAPNLDILQQGQTKASALSIARPRVVNKRGWRGNRYETPRKGLGQR
jgi:hypothetical protein